MDANIKFVEDGYALAARRYRAEKDRYQATLPLFQEFLQRVDQQTGILELGCGGGYPIGEAILSQHRLYTGIDVSQHQIDMAKQEFQQWPLAFHKAEMLEFCRNAPAQKYGGILSFFSIRHLPRKYHVELFMHLYRILTPAGILLIDSPTLGNEGRGTWFDGLPMYWSSFSPEWVILTLTEIGFSLIRAEKDVQIFNAQPEETRYFLFAKNGEF